MIPAVTPNIFSLFNRKTNVKLKASEKHGKSKLKASWKQAKGKLIASSRQAEDKLKGKLQAS